MEAIKMLCSLIHLVGQDAFAFSFSAKSLAEDLNMSVYSTRKHLKVLREYGVVQRSGNRYMFTWEGWDIAKLTIKASQKYNMFSGVK